MEELDIEELEGDTLKRAEELIAEKEAELRLREAAIQKDRASLEQARKELAALRAQARSLLSALDRPPLEFGPAIMKIANEFEATVVAYGEIKNAMRATIGRIPVPVFSTREFINYLHHWHPKIKIESNRSNISSYLKDFVSEGLIQFEQEGSGQRPATFRKK